MSRSGITESWGNALGWIVLTASSMDAGLDSSVRSNSSSSLPSSSSGSGSELPCSARPVAACDLGIVLVISSSAQSLSVPAGSSLSPVELQVDRA